MAKENDIELYAGDTEKAIRERLKKHIKKTYGDTPSDSWLRTEVRKIWKNNFDKDGNLKKK